MFIVTAKIKRPNTDCSFYLMTDPMVDENVKEYWIVNYKAKKCLLVDITESSDRLELINVIYWDTEEDYLDYKNDQVLIDGLFNLRDAYFLSNGITYTIVGTGTV